MRAGDTRDARRSAGSTCWRCSRTALRRLQDWTDQFAPWWGTDAETLDNQAAADRDAALALARTNPMITSVVVHELAKM